MLVLFSWSTISQMSNSFHWVIKSQIIDCNSFNFNVDSIFLENKIQMCVSFNWEIKSQIILLILFTTILDEYRSAIYVMMENESVNCLTRAHVKVKVAWNFHGMDHKLEWFVCSYSWRPIIIDCNIKCKGGNKNEDGPK